MPSASILALLSARTLLFPKCSNDFGNRRASGKNSLSMGGSIGPKRFVCQASGTATKVRNVNGGVVIHDIRRNAKAYMAREGADRLYRDTILDHSLKGMDKYY